MTQPMINQPYPTQSHPGDPNYPYQGNPNALQPANPPIKQDAELIQHTQGLDQLKERMAQLQAQIAGVEAIIAGWRSKHAVDAQGNPIAIPNPAPGQAWQPGQPVPTNNEWAKSWHPATTTQYAASPYAPK